MFYEGKPNLENFKLFRVEQTDIQIKDAIVPPSVTDRVHTEVLAQTQPPINAETLIIPTGAPLLDNAASLEIRNIQTPPTLENKKIEHTTSLASNAAPPDNNTIVVAAPSIDKPPPHNAEIAAPTTVIIINMAATSLGQKTNDEIILVDSLGVTELQDTSGTPKHLLLTPSSVNKVFSQKI